MIVKLAAFKEIGSDSGRYSFWGTHMDGVSGYIRVSPFLDYEFPEITQPEEIVHAQLAELDRREADIAAAANQKRANIQRMRAQLAAQVSAEAG
jgi:hypothetical protein